MESPDAHLKKSLRGLADRTFLDANVRKYGRDSLWVRCHLDEIIPEVSHDTLIPVAWLDRAARRRIRRLARLDKSTQHDALPWTLVKG